MKTLYLLRHAKSSWSQADLPDFQRPLKQKGCLQADLISDHLSSLLPPPERALCSPSVRTRETLAYFLEVWPLQETAVRFPDSLYMGDETALLAEIRKLPASVDIALLVGHNPGLTDLAQALASSDAMAPKAIRPAGFLQLDFEETSWKEVGPGKGHVKLEIRPKDLQG